MSFSFLYPLAWFGALAVAVPIWLHLRRRQPRNLVRFSAMRFLEDQPATGQGAFWPQDWPLLLLRLAGLLLLIGAFAWPYVRGRQEAVVQESRVYVLDNTMSRQAGDGLQRDIERLAGELAAAGPTVQTAVVELTSQPRVIAPFSTDSAAKIAAVEAVKPSYQRGMYLAAFRTASDLLDRSLGQQRRVILLGDSQQNQWESATPNLPVAPFLSAEVELPEPSNGEQVNAALHRAAVQRMFDSAGNATIQCDVQLYYQGPAGEVDVVAEVNGQETWRRRVTLDGATKRTTLVARWPSDPAELVRGVVRFDGWQDALSGDDACYFAIPPVREGQVVVCASSPFLRAALDPEIMRGRWRAEWIDGATNPSSGDSEITGEGDVVMVEASALAKSPVRNIVTAMIDRGAGVVLMVDELNAPARAFLRTMKIEFPADTEQTPDPPEFRYLDLDHWLFRPLRASEYGLDRIAVRRYRRLEMPQAVPLAFSHEGDPLVLETRNGMSRIIVLAFGFDRDDTDWPVHVTFVPLLDRLLQRAAAAATIETDYAPGQICLWRSPPGRFVKRVSLRPVDDSGAAVDAVVEDGIARLVLPDRPGLYEIRYDGNSSVEAVLAVNAPPEESELLFDRDPKSLVAWKKQRSASSQSPVAVAGMAAEIRQARGQHIWWILLVAALAALAVETAWLAWKRDVS